MQNKGVAMPDKETAIMILALKFDLGTDKVKVLLESCASGDVEMLKLLLASEYVDIHVKNDRALLLSSYKGQKAVVEFLLSQEVYKQNVINEAIARASVSKNTEVLELLLDYGVESSVFVDVLASVDVRNKWYDAMVDVLVQMGEDVRVFDKQLLLYASIKGYKALVEVLFDKVIDSHIDEVVLKNAYANGHKDIVDWVSWRLDVQRMEQRIDMDKQRFSV